MMFSEPEVNYMRSQSVSVAGNFGLQMEYLSR
jgi:hypothetical protein